MRHGASLDDIALLYEERYADYLRVASAVTGSLESGRDAVHDGFVSAVRARRGFRGDGPLAGWLWRSVVNAALKRKRHEAPVGEAPSAEPAAPVEDESDAVTRAAIAMLPERQRLVLFLRYYADLDYGSIAAILEISTGTVGATLHAAHAALRRSLEEVPIR